MTIESTLDSIDQTEVDADAIEGFSTDRQHFDVAFNLFRECAGYVCVLANTTVGHKQTWSVDQAVLGGHLVRIFKMMCFVLEETIERRAEMLSILVRLLAEAVINLRFLIGNYSQELIQSYVFYSLQHEKELAERVRSNIQARGGKAIPIEMRMLRSIAKTFLHSHVTEDSLPSNKIRNWGDRNLFQKAKAVELEHAYSAIFGGLSRNVHGGWQDMLQHHLECVSPGEFRPSMKFSHPRQQVVNTLTHLVAETLVEYCDFLGHPAAKPVVDRVNGLIQRNSVATDLHEAYLSSKAN
jgi:Family of unknown function (DUF5677)